jgi:hypothetical protein
VSVLFAAFLGYNPIEHLVGPHVLASLSGASRATLTGRSFFPQLISAPFRTGLHEAFLFAIVACLIAAGASLLRGGKYEHIEEIVAPAGAHDAAQGNGRQRTTVNGAGALARVTTREERNAS